MQNNRFVVLTGHLSNYPLADLVGILRHQRKSGRLLIEYPKGPGMLFFEDGELVDVRLNELNGLQAICVLVAQPDASFNFNPLIKASQRSIEPSFQKVVSELFGCWDESAIQIESAPVVRTPELKSEPNVPSTPQALEGRSVERLALLPAPSESLQQRSLFIIAAAVLIIIAISTVIAVTGRLKQLESQASTPQLSTQISSDSEAPTSQRNKFGQSSSRGDGGRTRQQSPIDRREGRTSLNKKKENGASNEIQAKESASETANATDPTRKAQNSNPAAGAIKVIMQIENGRVLKASIANHAPGMDGFEALALRIARQRRYPVTKTGAEAVTINVNKPD